MNSEKEEKKKKECIKKISLEKTMKSFFSLIWICITTKNILPIISNLLFKFDKEVSQLVIHLLGNIAGEKWQIRNMLLDANITSVILQLQFVSL